MLQYNTDVEAVMMPTIRIDDDVWRYLQGKAKPFEDTPNDVLRRELGLEGRKGPKTPEGANGEREAFRADRDYSHLSVRGYRFDGKHVPCHTFKEVLLSVCNHLRLVDAASFDRAALQLRGRKRPYFSRTGSELRLPEQLVGHGLFVETNLNANLIVGICRAVLEKLGRRGDELVLEAD